MLVWFFANCEYTQFAKNTQSIHPLIYEFLVDKDIQVYERYRIGLAARDDVTLAIDW